MIFMIHPEHGAINVNEGDVEAHEKLGWIKSTREHWFFINGKGPKTEVLEEPKEVKRGRPRKG